MLSIKLLTLPLLLLWSSSLMLMLLLLLLLLVLLLLLLLLVSVVCFFCDCLFYILAFVTAAGVSARRDDVVSTLGLSSDDVVAAQGPAMFLLGLSKAQLARGAVGRERLLDELARDLVAIAGDVKYSKEDKLGAFITLAASPGSGKTTLLAALLLKLGQFKSNGKTVVSLPVTFNHTTSMRGFELAPGTQFSTALSVRLLFAATRAADRWKAMDFTEFATWMTESLTPRALDFARVCGALQQLCGSPFVVVIDEVSKAVRMKDVVDVLRATEPAFEVKHVACITAGVDPFAVVETAQTSGRPYRHVPVAPPNVELALAVVVDIVGRDLDEQERTVVALCASRWRAVVIAGDHLRCHPVGAPTGTLIADIAADDRLQFAKSKYPADVVYAALLGNTLPGSVLQRLVKNGALEAVDLRAAEDHVPRIPSIVLANAVLSVGEGPFSLAFPTSKAEIDAEEGSSYHIAASDLRVKTLTRILTGVIKPVRNFTQFEEFTFNSLAVRVACFLHQGAALVPQARLFGIPNLAEQYCGCDGLLSFPLGPRMAIQVCHTTVVAWAESCYGRLKSGSTTLVHFCGNEAQPGFDILMITIESTGSITLQPVEVKHHDRYHARSGVPTLSFPAAIDKAAKTAVQLGAVTQFASATKLPLAFCTWEKKVTTGWPPTSDYAFLVCRVDQYFSPTLTDLTAAQIALVDGTAAVDFGAQSERKDATDNTSSSRGAGAGCAAVAAAAGRDAALDGQAVVDIDGQVDTQKRARSSESDSGSEEGAKPSKRRP